MSTISEAWLRGPLEDLAPILHPVAYALIQSREDVANHIEKVPAGALWQRRNGAASAGFHLLHMAGALDRLFTYARGEMLTDEQKAAARAESQENPGLDAPALVATVNAAIDRAMAQLRATDSATLLEPRKVGRVGLPTTVFGALFHGAEHTARHAGQFVTTVKLL